ncbi:MAG: membrane-associated phospholipid [Prolixibacteraceae bacterium]|nr:MAG: membrane-associated phospholipid [Prolixibacteraceae bacterium]
MNPKFIKQILKENRPFLIPYLIFLVFAVFMMLTFSKTELHILSNKANSPFFDFFFNYATFLGDGAMIAILFIVLLFVKYRFAFAFLAGSLATAVIVNIIKKVLLHDVYRPAKYFELFETYQLHFVEGVKLYSLQSFPSGHTATAFNVFLTLAILSKNNRIKLLLFVGALLVGYSRVYLSQHFLIDITAGSVFGTLIILFFWIWFERFNKNWLEYSILKRTK